jgi:uncharacterized protein (TIRG00374 family)
MRTLLNLSITQQYTWTDRAVYLATTQKWYKQNTLASGLVIILCRCIYIFVRTYNQAMSSKLIKRILPFIVSVVLIIILINYAPWGEIGKILANLQAKTIILLILLSLVYYLLKIVRFWYLLRAMGIYKPLTLVAMSYISAQPVSLLPAGEAYRSHALKKYADVPIADSIGQFTLQGILEGGAMGIIMVIAALTLGKLRIVAILVLAFIIFSGYAIKQGYLVPVGKSLNKLPFVNIATHNIESFSKQNRAVLTWRWLPSLFGISLIIELTGATIAYASVAGIGGHVNVFQAALLYIIPVIVGFISFLPGGFGLSEQSAIGVLYLSNITLARAVAATLIMRITIVALGVIYGLMALIVGQFYLKQKDLSAD